MCGVVGYVSSNPTGSGIEAFCRLMTQSRIRGLHAAGIAYRDTLGQIEVVKGRNLELPLQVLRSLTPTPTTIVGHTRYSTSGDFQDMANNQPIVVDDSALVFNGVISMGTKEEFEKQFDVECASYNDGEVVLRKEKQGHQAHDFVNSIEGSFAGLIMNRIGLRAFRNPRRPLWKSNRYPDHIFFASTKDIFVRAGFDPQYVVEVSVKECVFVPGA